MFIENMKTNWGHVLHLLCKGIIFKQFLAQTLSNYFLTFIKIFCIYQVKPIKILLLVH